MSEHDPSLHEIAEKTSEEIQPPDPYVEPPNSTVDDWFGQRVERDAERLEQSNEGTAD